MPKQIGESLQTLECGRDRSKTCSTSAVSTSATKQCVHGGINLDRCLRRKLGNLRFMPEEQPAAREDALELGLIRSLGRRKSCG